MERLTTYPDFAPGDRIRVLWESGRITDGICTKVDVGVELRKWTASEYRVREVPPAIVVRAMLDDVVGNRAKTRLRKFERTYEDRDVPYRSAGYGCSIVRLDKGE